MAICIAHRSRTPRPTPPSGRPRIPPDPHRCADVSRDQPSTRYNTPKDDVGMQPFPGYALNPGVRI